MIDKLKIKNFTVFDEADISFAKGINVIIGSNSTGKSHLLKLAYTAVRWSQEMALREHQLRQGLVGNGSSQARPDKSTLQKALGEKLNNVFRSEGIGRLVSKGKTGRAEVAVTLSSKKKSASDFTFSFSPKSSTDASLDTPPDTFFDGEAVFFPTKEMLTMVPGFRALYENYALQIDETYYDLCKALEKPLARGPKLAEIRPMLTTVEEILGGSIQQDHGRFYLTQGKERLEIPLVAEGYRKLGAVAYLLANGTLAKQSILFWDEPETNLNPAYMVKLAELLVAISKNNTQVFIATHSLFMMRELSMLLGKRENRALTRSFMAFSRVDGRVSISNGTSAEDVEPIAALDAELEQSERYLEADAVSRQTDRNPREAPQY